MKLQLLPSTIETNGEPSGRQHLTCFVIDDTVAVDAGSLAMAASRLQREQVRDVILTHSHLDHIAGLPLFIDDLFATLEEPVTVYGTGPVIDALERDIFNWSIYPRFSELSNATGPVLAYKNFRPGEEFTVRHLTFRAIEVNHRVPCVGFVIADSRTSIALSGDTAEMDGFWDLVNKVPKISAILVECAFPDELEELAEISHHLTPSRLRLELEKCSRTDCPVYVVNLKPMYRDSIIQQLTEIGRPNLEALKVGHVYEW